MENAIELKDIYKDVVRNDNNISDLCEFVDKNFKVINDNNEAFMNGINEIGEACSALTAGHKAVIFGGLVICGGLLILSTRIKRQNVKIKALEQRVESLERRRNLHVCSGDCGSEE